MGNNYQYNFNWVLVNELAISNLPKDNENLDELLDNDIVSVLSLCETEEIRNLRRLQSLFNHKIITLPDHRINHLPHTEDLINAIDTINNFKKDGPVLVHCQAGVERSPLICIGYLMKYLKYSFIDSLDYMMEVHPNTNPLTSHLDIIKNIRFT